MVDTSKGFNLYKTANREALVVALTQRVSDVLRKALEQRGEATLAVSGGRSPVALLQALSEINIDWQKVTVTLVDDRWVDANHEDSNEQLVKNNLLINAAKVAQFIPLVNAAENAFSGITQAEQQWLASEAVGSDLDCVILGMGDDGHTASLFPCSEQINECVDLNYSNSLIAVEPKYAPHTRVSLSLPKLIAAKHIFLLLYGEGKLAVFDRATAELNKSAWLEMPIRAVIANTGEKFSAYWAP